MLPFRSVVKQVKQEVKQVKQGSGSLLQMDRTICFSNLQASKATTPLLFSTFIVPENFLP